MSKYWRYQTSDKQIWSVIDRIKVKSGKYVRYSPHYRVGGAAGEGAESPWYLVMIGRIAPDYSEMDSLFYICFGNTYGRLRLLFLQRKLLMAYAILQAILFK